MKTLVPMEEIPCLEPGQSTKKIMEVHFHHHLLPVKLVLRCSGLKHPVKLWPDIGYFVKPLPMDDKEFFRKESQLRGMFEYNRRSVVWLQDVILFAQDIPIVLVYMCMCFFFFAK